jgi:hypothetical protein
MRSSVPPAPTFVPWPTLRGARVPELALIGVPKTSVPGLPAVGRTMVAMSWPWAIGVNDPRLWKSTAPESVRVPTVLRTYSTAISTRPSAPSTAGVLLASALVSCGEVISNRALRTRRKDLNIVHSSHCIYFLFEAKHVPYLSDHAQSWNRTCPSQSYKNR